MFTKLDGKSIPNGSKRNNMGIMKSAGGLAAWFVIHGLHSLTEERYRIVRDRYNKKPNSLQK